jgi:sulfate transport system ATP-binding protein
MATPSLAPTAAIEAGPQAGALAGARTRAGTRLALRGVSKRYAGLAALDGIDLDVEAGELVALLGPSGSGKTTLLRVVAGLLEADAGHVRFGDVDATRLSLRERNVGFVFQHYALFRHMTVAENVAFGLKSRPRARRPSKAEIDRRVQELLALVQLPEHGGRFPDQLSGGQKQRIALGRALAIEPSVLLLDEPFGALDAKVRVELRRWLRRLHERTGQTTLFVTHDQEEALELADRVVLMNRGRIEQVGTPADIYQAPATAFAFDFIGRSVLLDGQVDDGLFALPGDGFRLPVDAPRGASRLAFRPHDVRLAEPGQGFAATVTDIREFAGERRVDLRLAGTGAVVEVSDRDARVASAEVGLRPLRYRVFPR